MPYSTCPCMVMTIGPSKMCRAAFEIWAVRMGAPSQPGAAHQPNNRSNLRLRLDTHIVRTISVAGESDPGSDDGPALPICRALRLGDPSCLHLFGQSMLSSFHSFVLYQRVRSRDIPTRPTLKPLRPISPPLGLSPCSLRHLSDHGLGRLLSARRPT